MTIAEFLESLPEEKREMIAEYLYSRVPCRFGIRSKAVEDTPEPLPIPSVSSLACPAKC